MTKSLRPRPIFQITNVTQRELEDWDIIGEIWHKENKIEGLYTRSRFLKHLLEKFKFCGYEDIDKEDGTNISVSTFSGIDIKMEFASNKYKRSQAVRKYINKRVKKWKKTN